MIPNLVTRRRRGGLCCCIAFPLDAFTPTSSEDEVKGLQTLSVTHGTLTAIRLNPA